MISIRRHDKNCILSSDESPLTTETYSRMTEMPGFKRWEDYNLVFRPTENNIKHIMRSWPDAQWLEGTDEYPTRVSQTVREAEIALTLKTSPLPARNATSGYQYQRPPRDHQRRALLLSWDRPAFALLMEQRTGKTKVVIDNAAYLYELGKLHTLIIITINGVHRNWIENEVPQDLPSRINARLYYHKASLSNGHKKIFSDAINHSGLRIFSFNIEALSRDGAARDMLEMVLGDGEKVMVVVDESADCIKTYDAKRTKYLIKACDSASYKRILTGTQAPEGRPDELFPQYKFLDENIIGYDTITTFRARFCNMVSMDVGGGHERSVVVPGCKNVDELQGLIEPYSFRIRRSECMDLPPKVYKRWPVELSPRQAKLYKELRDEYLTELDGQTLSAPLVITRMLRLQQIVCGWFPMEQEEMTGDETWKGVQPIDKMPNARLEALLDILRTNEDKKAIIWARFRPDLECIQKLLGEAAVSYHGGVGSDKKAENYRRFQLDDKVRYFIANPASAGTGLTLTRATLHVYYSNSFRLGHRLQSEDRSEGDESRRDSTLVIDLESPDTIESKIIRSLRNKKNMADMINRDPKAIFLER